MSAEEAVGCFTKRSLIPFVDEVSNLLFNLTDMDVALI
jgi:hypothetical protein